MRRLVLIVTLLTAPVALATGERIVLSPPDQPLRAALCLSLTCVDAGAREATVTSRAVRGALEVTVTMRAGEHRVVDVVPLNDAGRPGAADLLRAATRVIQAIEQGAGRKGPPRPVVRRPSSRGTSPRG